MSALDICTLRSRWSNFLYVHGAVCSRRKLFFLGGRRTLLPLHTLYSLLSTLTVHTPCDGDGYSQQTALHLFYFSALCTGAKYLSLSLSLSSFPSGNENEEKKRYLGTVLPIGHTTHGIFDKYFIGRPREHIPSESRRCEKTYSILRKASLFPFSLSISLYPSSGFPGKWTYRRRSIMHAHQ